MKLNRSVQRSLALLEAMAAADEPVGPARLAAAVDLDKATVSRLLMTFLHEGYVTHNKETGRYALTNRVLRLSRGFLAHSDVRLIAWPHLVALRDQTNETVHLGQRDGERVVYIDKLESEQSIRMVSSVGQSMPLHTTALGKAILATMSPETMREVVAGLDLGPRTSSSITDPQKLLEELESAAGLGYAPDRGENQDSVFCVGSAMVDGSGDVVGAVSVSGPAFRLSERLEEVGEQCRGAAQAISNELRTGVSHPAAHPGEARRPAPTSSAGQPPRTAVARAPDIDGHQPAAEQPTRSS